MEFKIGDRVCYVNKTLNITFRNGKQPLGTIIGCDGTHAPYLVEFDEKIFNRYGSCCGHNGLGLCQEGRGRWCTAKELKAINPEISNSHYQTDIQPIEVMQANMTHEELIGFLKGNIIKYVCRCGRKDAPAKEAAKIHQYSKWLVEALEGRKIDPKI